jgi:SPP1 gp7 family putative phage head morphogenesis protein
MKKATFSQHPATAVPVDIGIIDRISRGQLRLTSDDPQYSIANIKPETWMSPGQPIMPVAQEVKGRTWDMPVGYNLNIQTRQYEGIGFDELKALANNCEFIRGSIDTCKDQINRIEWKILYRDKGKKSDINSDPKLRFWQEFWAKPDRINTFARWTRKLFEDYFVTDAATVRPRFTNGGKIYSLDIFDGSTIIPRIDTDGLIPDPPSVAYQQRLKGLPAVDFNRDELIYAPANPRPGYLYGLPVVEKIIMTVNIILRRQVSILNYYTEGNIPEAIVGVPESWTPDQVKQFQLFWDDMLQGNLAQRRHMKFVPGGLAYHDTKAPPLKDLFDEWLSRVVLWHFSLPPTPFVSMMNRDTSETVAEAAREEGIPSRLQWLKEDIMDRVMLQCGDGDIEAKWIEEEDTDPQVQAEIDNTSVRNGTMTINEVRASRGQKPLKGGDEPLIYTASGAVKLNDILNPPEPEPVTAIPNNGNKKPVKDDPNEQANKDANKLAKTAKDDSSGETIPKSEKLVVRLVDGDEVRDKNFIDFTMGGHHYVYDFIPENEIWIEQDQVDEDILATECHEFAERLTMKYLGLDYDTAHTDFANKVEIAYRKALEAHAKDKQKKQNKSFSIDLDLGLRKDNKVIITHFDIKLVKASKIKPINRNRTEVHKAQAAIQKQVMKIFQQGRRAVRKLKMPVAKADEATETKINHILEQLDMDGWAVIQDATSDILEELTKDGVYQALLQIGLDDSAMTEQMNSLAVKWAEDHSAELVSIDDATKNFLRSDISTAVEEGWSNRQLGNTLAQNYAFSVDRAETIARTETATADVQGNLIAYKESGVVEGKEWIVGDECCDDCADNEDAGVIPLDDDFPSGDDAPPLHPSCRCDLLPVMGSEE